MDVHIVFVCGCCEQHCNEFWGYWPIFLDGGVIMEWNKHEITVLKVKKVSLYSCPQGLIVVGKSPGLNPAYEEDIRIRFLS